MEEKDRKIHLLEFKIEQLMKDTKTIVEDQSRLQVENTTLLKALSTLDKKQQVTKGGEKWWRERAKCVSSMSLSL